MRNIIDVMLVVDASQILQDHTNRSGDEYIELNRYGEGYVFMLGPWSNVAHQTNTSEVTPSQQNDHQEEEGGYELKVYATVGDVIRFRIQSLALQGGYQCYLHEFKVSSHPQCVTNPSPRHFPILSTTLDRSSLQPVVHPAEDQCWESTMLQAGTVTYTAYFAVFDDSAKCLGRFFFDPWIIVQP